ncbi:MAG: class I SAM-dependent methyltransferase [Candidatus Yanofskybacteria bacterium]|nr:class I SAM-dependent methyltransferase [Candidatus Yanofskybacteria bacterium]
MNSKMDVSSFVKAPKNKKELSWWRRKYYNGIVRLVEIYNTIIKKPVLNPTGSPEYDEVLRRAQNRTDINDHLPTIFEEALKVQPNLIVELGVGPGESTFALESVAKLSKARFISVDIRESVKNASSWPEWIFVQQDDIAFATSFEEWARNQGIDPRIDVLFIDTSHRYEHTVQEIYSWFPFLSSKAVVLFHDTNVKPVYKRQDGSIGLAYDIRRGVIRAIEEFVGVAFQEQKDFTYLKNNWFITHHATCNGLTILKKIGTSL